MKKQTVNTLFLALLFSTVVTSPVYGMLDKLNNAKHAATNRSSTLYTWIANNPKKSFLALSALYVLSDYIRGESPTVELINAAAKKINFFTLQDVPRMLSHIGFVASIGIRIPAWFIIWVINQFPGTTVVGSTALLTKLGYDKYESLKQNNIHEHNPRENNNDKKQMVIPKGTDK